MVPGKLSAPLDQSTGTAEAAFYVIIAQQISTKKRRGRVIALDSFSDEVYEQLQIFYYLSETIY
eukprot:scaffold216322_cov19-Prasinocladus_malaysianus.AAC.1